MKYKLTLLSTLLRNRNTSADYFKNLQSLWNSHQCPFAVPRCISATCDCCWTPDGAAHCWTGALSLGRSGPVGTFRPPPALCAPRCGLGVHFHKEPTQEYVLAFLRWSPSVCSTQFSDPVADSVAVVSHLGALFLFHYSSEVKTYQQGSLRV